MREILFRGKQKDNGEWIEGIPIQNKIGIFICYDENPHYCSQYYYMEIQDIAEIIPETICEYTGLTDKNGKKVFENDIVKDTTKSYGGYHEHRYERSGIAVVKHGYHHVTAEDDSLYYGIAYGWYFDGDTVRETPVQYYGYNEYQDDKRYQFEVIGNIFDNPELLKEGVYEFKK